MEGEAPDDGVEVVACFEYGEYFSEEVFVFEFPEDESEIELVLVEYIFVSEEVVDLFIGAGAEDVVECFCGGGGFCGEDGGGGPGLGVGDDGFVFAGVGGVEGEGAGEGEVELSFEGVGGVGL